MSSKYIFPAVAAVGLLAGLVFGHFKQKNKPENTSDSTHLVQEQQDIRTDSFSIRLFQDAINDAAGNTLVAPRIVTQALRDLQAIAGGVTREELNQLKLSTSVEFHKDGPSQASLLAVDINVPRSQTPDGMIVLPFSENFPMALSMFNGTLARFAPASNSQYATSDIASERTKLLGGCVAYHQMQWAVPFASSNSQLSDFDCASGSMPKVMKMRARGMFRTAEAEDGSWKAIALFQSLPESNNSLAFIGILPSVSARDFASKLTPEQLSEIRKSLVKAQPEDTLVELPRIRQYAPAHDMRFSLRRMGLKSMFDPTTADFSALSDKKIHLGAMLHACQIFIQESKSNQPADEHLDEAKTFISFSRPFIWMLGDLTTESPMEFMGLVEEM